MVDVNEEMKQEFENNREKYAISKQIVQRWICRTCGKKHQYSRGYAWCVLARKFKKLMKNPKTIPKWKPEGSREEIFKNYEWIKSFYWGWMNSKIVKRDEWTCQECRRCAKNDFALALEVHHIISRYQGGSDHPHNLKTLCRLCHRKETNELLKNKQLYHPNQTSLKEREK